MTFPYRLFILYAESRNLLPIKEFDGYGQKSLKLLREEIGGKAGSLEGTRDDKLSTAYSSTGDNLYRRLIDLCTVVDKGISKSMMNRNAWAINAER